ncbi:MAG: hypothetical protein D6816_15550 [Bacteroidetes bacterium]|nr:MAG: hypothetical protein D6816_15550 [Bacteroidota bacterium]
MKLTSQGIGNTNLLLAINLVAFVVLLNVLLFLLQSDTNRLSSNLSALSSELNQETAKAVLTTEKTDVNTVEGVYFLASSAMLPLQPGVLISLLTFRQ